MGFGDSIGSFYIENGIDPWDPDALNAFLFPEEFVLDSIFQDVVKNARTVFVDNLDAACTSEELQVRCEYSRPCKIEHYITSQEAFDDCGIIESVRFPTYQSLSPCAKGFAFIQFAEEVRSSFYTLPKYFPNGSYMLTTVIFSDFS